jgi:hypothetical protein
MGRLRVFQQPARAVKRLPDFLQEADEAFQKSREGKAPWAASLSAAARAASAATAASSSNPSYELIAIAVPSHSISLQKTRINSVIGQLAFTTTETWRNCSPPVSDFAPS